MTLIFVDVFLCALVLVVYISIPNYVKTGSVLIVFIFTWCFIWIHKTHTLSGKKATVLGERRRHGNRQRWRLELTSAAPSPLPTSVLRSDLSPVSLQQARRSPAQLAALLCYDLTYTFSFFCSYLFRVWRMSGFNLLCSSGCHACLALFFPE